MEKYRLLMIGYGPKLKKGERGIRASDDLTGKDRQTLPRYRRDLEETIEDAIEEMVREEMD